MCRMRTREQVVSHCEDVACMLRLALSSKHRHRHSKLLVWCQLLSGCTFVCVCANIDYPEKKWFTKSRVLKINICKTVRFRISSSSNTLWIVEWWGQAELLANKRWVYLPELLQNENKRMAAALGVKKVNRNMIGESQIEILSTIFLKDVCCARGVRLAGWLGWGSARPAGLHIADRCSVSQACSTTGSVCSRKTLRPDATTWCPTRLPPRYTGHAPVAITWPQTRFWDCVPSINNTDDRVEWKCDWKPSRGRLSRLATACLTGWIYVPDCFE